VDATGMPQNKTAAKAGGRIAAQARHQLENQTGKSVVTGESFLPPTVKKTAKKLPKA
jgi:DNA-damage-inducible protein D